MTTTREIVDEIDRRIVSVAGLLRLCELAAGSNLQKFEDAIGETLSSAIEGLRGIPALTQLILVAEKKSRRPARPARKRR